MTLEYGCLTPVLPQCSELQ